MDDDWKELGEIPDSEDEDGFDSQNTLPEVPLPEINLEVTPTKPSGGILDVLDVPSSAQDDNDEQPELPVTTKGSSSLTKTKLTGRKPQNKDDWEVPSSLDELAGPSTPIQQPITKTRVHLTSATSLIISPKPTQVTSNQSDTDSPLSSLASSPILPPIDFDSSSRPGSSTPRPLSPAPPPFVEILDIESSLSSLASSQDLPSIDQLARQNADIETTSQRSPNEQADLSSPADDISTSIIDVASTTLQFTGLDHVSDSLPRPIKPSSLQNQNPVHHEEHEDARRVAMFQERSLRKRKPEQLRPYFTEMTRFANEWRSHGLRPVRIANDESSRREREPSAEPDFDPKSQTSQPQISEDSQGHGVDDRLNASQDESVYLPPQNVPVTRKTNNEKTPPDSFDEYDSTIDWDDLPSVEALASNRPSDSARKERQKRKSSLVYSIKRKGRKSDIGEDAPSSERGTRFIRPPESPKRAFPNRPRQSPRQSPRSPSPDPFDFGADSPIRGAIRHSKVAPVTVLEPMLIEDDSEDDDTIQRFDAIERDKDNGEIELASSSESEEEIVNKNRKRIKGVLPASWLRLDQPSGRDKIQQNINHRHDKRSPQRENKRGVAQRRIARVGSMLNDLIFDTSEEEDDEPSRLNIQTTDKVFHNQRTLDLKRTAGFGAAAAVIPVEDFIGSDSFDMEDDRMDRMAFGKKRQIKLSDSFGRQAKRTKTGASKSSKAAPAKSRQPKITSTFGYSGTTGSTKKPRNTTQPRKSNGVSKETKVGRSRPRQSQRPLAPHLSILDVIKPNAPNFVKVAARTAKKRPDQGRGSPRNKFIQLATRDDHVDAFTVLQDWKRGELSQRSSVTAAKKANQSRLREERPPQQRPTKSRHRQPGLSFNGAPRKLTKQTSGSGRVLHQQQKSKTNGTLPSSSQRHGDPANLQRHMSDRPGQLEIEDHGEPSSLAFHAGKRLLDRLYHGKFGIPSMAGSLVSGTTPVNLGGQRQQAASNQQSGVSVRRHNGERQPAQKPLEPQRRRKTRPRMIDTDAPQYSHANDPLPASLSPVPDSESTQQQTEGPKLLGLGPYGTHYTHHFEIFPLDSSVFFHDSTLIGSGAVTMAMREDYCQGLKGSKPQTSFVLRDQTLRWGTWDAQVSSEFGIVFDFIADQICVSWPSGEHSTVERDVVGAAGHVWAYSNNSLSFNGELDGKSFVSRLMEVMQSFCKRLSTHFQDVPFDQVLLRTALGILDRLMLVTFLTLRMCRNDVAMVGEQFKVEDMLKEVIKLSLSITKRTEMRELKQTYADLCKLRFRERGLRQDSPTIHSCLLAMRIMEFVQIPRGSFWDIVQKVLVSPQIAASVQTQELEKVWEAMFILLPLTEFNDMGVLVSGSRHTIGVDGWSIPQKLVKRVLDIYQQNTRQAASFNNYCRSIVGRCHYLVEQWGWHRCSVIIGVIFDFFGSQNLAHLRNEEHYTSPRFLNELAHSPRLEIEPEDRCFHVFLKLVALAILKLKGLPGSTKHIRNLIARTVPNHNRQYLKEQNIHERDLAALRNHHDLLCTLYWAAPPELRPSVSLIERLVVPASSHKEACLINFRAWNQLTQYVVASGEATTSLKPFNQWRNSFFQQMMQQFDTVASDIEQQFLGLSQDVSNSISRDMINAMVAMNKAAVIDVLHVSVLASLDVMKHAPDLEAAMFCLNSAQLQQVFRHFSVAPAEMQWSILKTSLGTLDVFLSRVDEFKDGEQNPETESQILNSAQADDALLVLSHDVADGFFTMARCVLSTRGGRSLTAMGATERAMCLEDIVVLAARMGKRFIDADEMTLDDMFKSGKRRLFQDLPHKLGVDQKRYLTLFISTLLKVGFSGIETGYISLIDIWMLSIVRPRETLSFEHQLAEQLIKHGCMFVPENMTGLASSPNYGDSKSLFEYAISWIRTSIQDDKPSISKVLMAQYARTLKLVMGQIKDDLKTLCENRSEHAVYVGFVRDIISLIRAHASDICPVDDYFYQMNKEYSPPVQDPGLQIAGMMSYGLRLAEAKTSWKWAHQLFFFLFNNFKISMKSDRLGETVSLLKQGMMRDVEIFGFVMGNMIPALLKAMSYSIAGMGAWVMLDVYVGAVGEMLSGMISPWVVLGKHHDKIEQREAPSVAALGAAVGFFQVLVSEAHNGADRLAMRHVMRQVMGLVNLLSRALYGLSFDKSRREWDTSFPFLEEYFRLTHRLEIVLRMDNSGVAFLDPVEAYEIDLNKLFGRDGYKLVEKFAENIVSDVRKNWSCDGRRISLNALATQTITQSTQTSGGGEGVMRPEWDEEDLREDILSRAEEGNLWWDEVVGGIGRKKECVLVF